MATTFKIHPAIGIARLGNSPEFFIGPELPGDHSPPNDGYKDKQCRLKKQAARFRIFRYENGVLNGEVTAADATIVWTAELANTKGAFDKFVGVFEANAGPRNSGIANRASLKITPGARTLNGPNQSASFDTGSFRGVNVPLGEMRTEQSGRLLILGGWGKAGSPSNTSLGSAAVDPNPFANHDDWFDDVSDGPIKATVTLNGTNTPIDAAPAWVICAPPKYAPAIEDIITLYDVLFQVAVDKLLLPKPVGTSFGKDVFPILDRADKMKWLFKFPGSDHSIFSSVIPPGPGQDFSRQTIAGLHRDPAENVKLANVGNADMPKIWSDGFSIANTVKTTSPLTKTQFTHMQNWAGGTFTADPPPTPDTQLTPEGLDRAALENCVGAAFFPGIETSWMTRDVYTYTEAFRLDQTNREPGDLTKQMSVPWQADFQDCADGDHADTGDLLLWWPAHRPLQVFPEDGSPQTSWQRDLAFSAEVLIKNFHRLGLVVQKGNQFLETERQPGCKNCYLIVDKSTFGQDEAKVQAAFTPAYWVAVEGFSNNELQLNAGNLNNPPIKPAISISFDPALNPGLTQTQMNDIKGMISVDQFAAPVVPQDPSLATEFQRFLYPFTVSFNGDAGFTTLQANQVAFITLTASITAGSATRSASAVIELTRGQDPYFLNVNPSDPNQPFWLSFDTRFFKVIAGQPKFGAPAMSSNPDDAPQFITKVIDNLNTPGANLGGDSFDGLTQDEGQSALEFLKTNNNSELTFNFALARVRLLGKTPNAQAKKVRVFFRLFQAQTTVSDFNEQTTYRFATDNIPFGHKIPRLGVQNDQNGQPEYVTIPCFATRRVVLDGAGMDTQNDVPNARDITVNPGVEVDTYFGCWLDINQPQQKVLPATPPPGNFDGQWNGITLVSINEAITKSPHQCLIAEIRYDDTPVPPGASSATSDKLAQRNIAWIDGPNPGVDASRQMPHPFEIRPTPPNTARPDELMIMWGNTPGGSNAYFYLPALNASDIINLADTLYSSHSLTSDDPNTIKCPAAGVTFIPLPAGTARCAGLMTIDLAAGIRRGERFNIAVRQLSDASTSPKAAPPPPVGVPQIAAAVLPKAITWRTPLGAFEVALNISTKDQLLFREQRLLAWLRWILLGLPAQNRWYPVMRRYVDLVAGRVRGFGGDPDTIGPSPEGNVPGAGSQSALCRYLCILILIVGLILLLLGLLILLGFGTPVILWLLAVFAVLEGLLVIVNVFGRCCGFRK